MVRSDIIKKLYEREKLGSTSIGKGVAIPHARIQNIEYPFLSITLNDTLSSLKARLILSPELISIHGLSLKE